MHAALPPARLARRLHALFAVVLVVTTAMPQESASMQPAFNPAVTLARLPDEAYFALDEKTLAPLGRSLVTMLGQQGIAIGAPTRIDIAERQALPLLWLRRSTVLRNWQVQRLRNSMVIVSDLDRGIVNTFYAFTGPKKMDFSQLPRSAEGERPDADASEGATVSKDVLNVRMLANLAWQPGRLAVTVLMHDWVSNTVRVELARGTEPAAAVPPFPRAAAASLDDYYRKQAQLAEPVIRFERSAATPALAGPGPALAISVPRSVDAAAARWMAHAAGRVVLTPASLVATDAADAGGLPTAIVAVTMIVATLDQTRCAQGIVRVPIRQPGAKVGDLVDFAFDFELKAVLRGSLPAGTHQIYLASGEQVAGPFALKVN